MWEQRVRELETFARERLKDLRNEEDEIFRLFPKLKPPFTKRGRIKQLYHGTHWTGRPEKRERMLENVRLANEGKRAKAAARGGS